MISHRELCEMLSYDEESGQFSWICSRGRARRGDLAGKIVEAKPGYRRRIIGIKGRAYKAHRLAWFYVFGQWPSAEIDHVNCDPLDNRIANLRLATHSENHRNRRRPKNNTSGVKGVTWHAQAKRWKAQIKHNGENKYLGIFASIADAAEARAKAAEKLHGDFARIG